VRRLVTCLLILLAMVTAASAAEVQLSVAASMTDAVKALIAAYRSQAPEVGFQPNFGSSGTLAKQIAQGAPADLFISANPTWMDYLVEQGLVPADQVRPLAGNALVLVGQPGPTVESLADVAKLTRIAIGSPKSVPAGQYAEQALRAAGLYERVQGRLVLAKDVRQALIYADRGEVEGAFVYRTDALLAQTAGILLEVPPTLYDPVVYPLGLTVAGTANPAAVKFVGFLQSAEAAGVLKKFGFMVK